MSRRQGRDGRDREGRARGPLTAWCLEFSAVSTWLPEEFHLAPLLRQGIRVLSAEEFAEELARS